MPNIYLCFVWHMHQPFYKDLMSGEYKLPWTRMHALKDYYGMVSILEEFPEVHQTFNLVPSMLEQIRDYADQKAVDPFLRVALKPAEELTEEEQAFLLSYFFQAHPSRMIGRYPRYAEIHDGWQASDRNLRRARHFFSPRVLRDLQVLSQLAWFDEEFQANDEEVRALIAKERDYTLEDQALMGRKQVEILNRVIPVYRDFAAEGQIELTTTPFYHPILPLLCDSNIAGVAHPYVPLPTRFTYPQDARYQLAEARKYHADLFGVTPSGFWPSEGSVSDEVFSIAADLGFTWAASDNGVLSRTLHHAAGVHETYRPYLWQQGGRQLKLIFRDHYLSDLIGFVYSRMDSSHAAAHFLSRIRENCSSILAAGRDALVPVILDGENAWEHYEQNGRPFLRELYRRITLDPSIHALTVSEGLARVQPQTIAGIFPGSWINANFDVWIGAEEDNKAWEMLLRARRTYDEVSNHPALDPEQKKLAFEELLIAEGSDWCWWYGPEHFTANRAEFDHLFRSHLANVYRALGIDPPDELSRPILKVEVAAYHERPSAPIRPTIDGEVSSYFEWMGAGVYRVDTRSGSMHSQRVLVHQLHYGGDRHNLFLRLDLEAIEQPVRLHCNFDSVRCNIELSPAVAQLQEEDLPFEAAYGRIFELRVPLSALGLAPGQPVKLQLSLWQDALPIDALPQEGWLELSTADPGDWAI